MMNTNSAFTEHFQGNPFHYQKFGLQELRTLSAEVEREYQLIQRVTLGHM